MREHDAPPAFRACPRLRAAMAQGRHRVRRDVWRRGAGAGGSAAGGSAEPQRRGAAPESRRHAAGLACVPDPEIRPALQTPSERPLCAQSGSDSLASAAEASRDDEQRAAPHPTGEAAPPGEAPPPQRASRYLPLPAGAGCARAEGQESVGALRSAEAECFALGRAALTRGAAGRALQRYASRCSCSSARRC